MDCRGPYIQDGHYMYGNVFIQPYPAYYNSAWYHRTKTPYNRIPPRAFGSDIGYEDDGSLYIPQNKPDQNASVIRDETMHSVVNIETTAYRSLKIRLYAMKEEDDTELILEIGRQYAITYVTEGGLKLAKGILKMIDSSIPDKCTRYIGEFNETVATAWIAMDCSTNGKSDKRKIYVASIRAIEEVPEDDEDYIPPTIDAEAMSDTEKLNNILNAIPNINNLLNMIVYKVQDNDEIMDKLDELDPTQKLAYIVSKLDDNTPFEEIKQMIATTSESTDSNVNSKADEVKSKIDEISTKIDTVAAENLEAITESITNHNTSVNSKFASIMSTLGNMQYNDKIDYLYNQFVLSDDSETMADIAKSTREKTNEILAKLEEIDINNP